MFSLLKATFAPSTTFAFALDREDLPRSYHFMANGWEMWKQCQISFSWAPKSMRMVTTVMKLKDTCSLEEQL